MITINTGLIPVGNIVLYESYSIKKALMDITSKLGRFFQGAGDQTGFILFSVAGTLRINEGLKVACWGPSYSLLCVSILCSYSFHSFYGPGKVDLQEASLLHDRPFSAAASVYISTSRSTEPPDIFQHQSTGYIRTKGQETLYETCACVIQTNLHYYSTTMRRSTISDLFLLHLKREPQRLRTTSHYLARYPSTKGQDTS